MTNTIFLRALEEAVQVNKVSVAMEEGGERYEK